MLDKSLLRVSYLLGMIFGILETITIIGAVVGIPTILLALQMKKYSEMSDAELNKNKDMFLLWSIILALISPICGVLALIYYIGLERENEKKLNK